MDRNELFWNLYLSERSFIQHHENQRTTASNILAAIAAGLIVSLGTANLSDTVMTAIPIMLMAIGVFGYFFCRKLTSLLKMHATRSYEYLKLLDEGLSEGKAEAVRKKSASEGKRLYPFFNGLPLSLIWSLFHFFIFGIGLLFLLLRLDVQLPNLGELLQLLHLAQK